MPEFVLDMGDDDAARLFDDLDEFTQGYVEAMFWTDTGSDYEEEELDRASFAELAPEALATIARECIEWQNKNYGALRLACLQDGYDMQQAGVDFWLTRNGHGAGFWDREELQAVKLGRHNDKGLGDVLSERCRHSDRSIYRGDDGLIYYTQG